jgi:Tfp pilus assembly protein FimT
MVIVAILSIMTSFADPAIVYLCLQKSQNSVTSSPDFA